MIRHLSDDEKSSIRTGVALSSFAQAVEELALNSIDAGASNVAVRVDLECFKIQVVDNGTGISIDQLPLLGDRYATSKCNSVEDLLNLKYFGFRGEALASLCKSSSFLEIVSRPKSSGIAYCKCFKNGKAVDISQSSVPRPSHGTTVTAHNLFYNLPVRRKCLQEGLEMEKIRYRLAGLAVMWPQICFSLRDDSVGQVILQTHKSNSLAAAFSVIFPMARSRNLSDVHIEQDEFKMSGIVSTDTYSRKDLQFVFVNKRLVLKSSIHHQINKIFAKSLVLRKKGFQDGGEGFLPFGGSVSPSKQGDRYAIFAINIECPYYSYDITFDPQKTLVEFINWPKLIHILQDMLYGFLRKKNLLSLTDQFTVELKDVGQNDDTDDSSNDESDASLPLASNVNSLGKFIRKTETSDLLTVKQNMQILDPQNKMSTHVSDRDVIKDFGTEHLLKTNEATSSLGKNFSQSLSDLSDTNECLESTPDCSKTSTYQIFPNSNPALSLQQKNSKNNRDGSNKHLFHHGVSKNKVEAVTKISEVPLPVDHSDADTEDVLTCLNKKKQLRQNVSLGDTARYSSTLQKLRGSSLTSSNVITNTLQNLRQASKKAAEGLGNMYKTPVHKVSDFEEIDQTPESDRRKTHILLTYPQSEESQSSGIFNSTIEHKSLGENDRKMGIKRSQIENVTHATKLAKIMKGEKIESNKSTFQAQSQKTDYLKKFSFKTQQLECKKKPMDAKIPFQNQRIIQISSEINSVGQPFSDLTRNEPKMTKLKLKDSSVTVTEEPQNLDISDDPEFNFLPKCSKNSDPRNSRPIQMQKDKLLSETHQSLSKSDNSITKNNLLQEKLFGSNVQVTELKNDNFPISCVDMLPVTTRNIIFESKESRNQIVTSTHPELPNFSKKDKSQNCNSLKPAGERCLGQTAQKHLTSDLKFQSSNVNKETMDSANEFNANTKQQEICLENPFLLTNKKLLDFNSAAAGSETIDEYLKNTIISNKKTELLKIPLHDSCGNEAQSTSNTYIIPKVNFLHFINKPKTSDNFSNKKHNDSIHHHSSKNSVASCDYISFRDNHSLMMHSDVKCSQIATKLQTETMNDNSHTNYVSLSDGKKLFVNKSELTMSKIIDSDVLFETENSLAFQEKPVDEEKNSKGYLHTNSSPDLSLCLKSKFETENILPKEKDNCLFQLNAVTHLSQTCPFENICDSMIKCVGLPECNEANESSNPIHQARTSDIIKVSLPQPLSDLRLAATGTSSQNLNPGITQDSNSESRCQGETAPISLVLKHNIENSSSIVSTVANSLLDVEISCWKEMCNEYTGKNIFVNMKSGHTISEEQWNELHAKEDIEQESLKEKVITQLSGDQKECLQNIVSHFINPERIDLDSKWKEGEKPIYDVDQGSDAATLITQWKNPVFQNYKLPTVNVETCPAGQAARSCFYSLTMMDFTKEMLKNVKVIGQVDKKFIACLVDTNDKLTKAKDQIKKTLLVLFDQHAAHERVRLEKLTSECYETKDGKKTNNVKKTCLPEPLLMTIDSNDLRIAQSFYEEFNRIGLNFTSVQGTRNQIHISSVPSCLIEKLNPKFLFEKIENLISEHVQLLKLSSGACGRLPLSLHRTLCSIACRGAVKFGDKLTTKECQDLVTLLSSCDLPFQCAHGRPSIAPLVDLRTLEEELSYHKNYPRLFKISKKICLNEHL